MREQTGREPAEACARAADLVAYLYGESDAGEVRDFRRHLNACAHCREELAAFGELRVRVGEWRAEALTGAPALGLSHAFAAPATGASTPRPSSSAPRARSARAALREFFALSPLWLRGATAAALVALVALAALALAPARTVTQVRRVEVPASDEQVEALVRERVREELAAAERRRQEQADATAARGRAKPEPRLEQAAGATPPRKRPPTPRAMPRGRRAAEDEESLPRLSDLLGGVY